MAKTIFHTTEKSNFILNLKPEDYRRHCRNIFLLCAALLTFGMIVRELSDSHLIAINDAFNAGGGKGLLAFLVIALRATMFLFAIAGVAAMVYAFIGLMKHQYTKPDILPAALLGATIFWGALSLYNSYDREMSLFGQDGRNEGLLALIFYACLFLIGGQLREKKLLQGLFDVLIGFGLFQCFWALLQVLPIGFPSNYRNLYPVLLVDVFLPSGLSGSPIAFAMLLTLLGGLSLFGALYDESKKRRIYDTVASAVFFFFLIRTQCLIGLLGAGLLLIGFVLALLLKKGGVKPLWKLGVFTLTIAVSLLLSIFAPAINDTSRTSTQEQIPSGFALYDGASIWADGYYRLDANGPYSISHMEYGEFDIDDPLSLYDYLWGKGLTALREDPWFGVGPENLMYTQLDTNLTFVNNHNTADKPYNDYLYIAATRGIPSLLLYLALLGIALVRCAKRLRQTRSWLYGSVLLSLVSFALISLIGISVITVAPFFWMLLGIACTAKAEDEA